MGLCGTGSKSIVVKDVIVPATHSVSLHELKTGTAPGAAVHPDNPLYRTPRNLLALFSLSSVVVGLAERAVERIRRLSPASGGRAACASADLEAMQLMVAEAAAQAETAALVGEHTIDRNAEMVESRQEITAEQVAWSRRNASYATQLAHSAVKLIFEAAGGTALYATQSAAGNLPRHHGGLGASVAELAPRRALLRADPPRPAGRFRYALSGRTTP